MARNKDSSLLTTAKARTEVARFGLPGSSPSTISHLRLCQLVEKMAARIEQLEGRVTQIERTPGVEGEI